MNERTPEDIFDDLSRPFERHEIKFKAGVVSGSRAMAIAFADARVYMDRLDSVLGMHNWCDEYQLLPDGSVLCKLSVRINGEWITKMDVGGQSDQPDEGDRHKASLSDAIKRTAVKFGVGRFLYRLPAQWVDYDPQKKRFVKEPGLPDHLYKSTPARSKPAETRPTMKVDGEPKSDVKRDMPANGAELKKRLEDKDRELVLGGIIQPGELLKTVRAALRGANFSDLCDSMNEAEIRLATQEVKSFIEKRKANLGKPNPQQLQSLFDLLKKANLTWETVARNVPCGNLPPGDINMVQYARAVHIAQDYIERAPT